ncbi:unnamed protein product [Rangifer tarandus platyrhynchus]|uniref:Uncharacterized protein n=1 Tax=Rangifer tarandus platyrhynchus TaxID=3082113 RepID=A0ABN8YW36_RANTA|nr:unnamed protein product [Rangifer tarandus platyrhynchus]
MFLEPLLCASCGSRCRRRSRVDVVPALMRAKLLILRLTMMTAPSGSPLVITEAALAGLSAPSLRSIQADYGRKLAAACGNGPAGGAATCCPHSASSAEAALGEGPGWTSVPEQTLSITNFARATRQP